MYTLTLDWHFTIYEFDILGYVVHFKTFVCPTKAQYYAAYALGCPIISRRYARPGAA